MGPEAEIAPKNCSRSSPGYCNHHTRAFLRPCHANLHVDVEGKLVIKKDTIILEIQVGSFPLRLPELILWSRFLLGTGNEGIVNYGKVEGYLLCLLRSVEREQEGGDTKYGV